MFNRVHYKRMAKRQLKRRWGLPILITLIVLVIEILFELPDLLRGFTYGGYNVFTTTKTITEYVSFANSGFPVLAILSFYILLVAQLYVYLKISEGFVSVTFNTFLIGLVMWLRALLSALWYIFWIFLWGCLFIIPGLVKMIEYSQIFYLVAEYPQLKIRKAMQISKILTRGHKADLFIMYLSFIGWFMVCGLTFGIGLLWVAPYMHMALTNAYKGIKQDALNTGVLTTQDFV